jgi:hypothetical protein
MRDEPTTYEALFAESSGGECRIMTITFRVEDEDDALAVAGDIALLEASELVYLSLSKCHY